MEVLDEVLGVKEDEELFVAVAFESKWEIEENRDAVFELFNPEFSRDSTENEDIRFLKRALVNTQIFDISFQFIQNWRECNRIVGTKLPGRPNNGEDIWYGKRVSSGSKRGTS